MGNSVGFWQSCSGCTEGVDGCINSRDYPPHPKHGVHTGAGCDECKGRGVVFQHFTKVDEILMREMANVPCSQWGST